MSLDMNESREAIAIRMKKYGFNFRHIGAALGVSSARGRQIFVRAERMQALREQAKKDPKSIYALGLSTRATKGLVKMGVEKVDQAKQLDIAELRARGVGRKSLKEISDALRKRGITLKESCRACGQALPQEAPKRR